MCSTQNQDTRRGNIKAHSGPSCSTEKWKNRCFETERYCLSWSKKINSSWRPLTRPVCRVTSNGLPKDHIQSDLVSVVCAIMESTEHTTWPFWPHLFSSLSNTGHRSHRQISWLRPITLVLGGSLENGLGLQLITRWPLWICFFINDLRRQEGHFKSHFRTFTPTDQWQLSMS